MPSWAEDQGLKPGQYFKEPGHEEILYREEATGRVYHLKNCLVQNVGVKEVPLKDAMGGGAKEGKAEDVPDSGTLKDRLLSKRLVEAEANKAVDK
jgi:hypothetical protein